ncbi:MAG: helix-turn-helix domain-containing protein [Bradyrhizobium sp.]
MDQWDFKKWRKNLGINQVAAGEMLGLSRGAVQYWESDIRPVPRAVELACQELLRRWKRRPEFGPVTLFYTDGPISQGDLPPSSDVTLQCERHPDNESALSRAVRLREIVNLFMPFIVADDGNVIWSGPELLHECDARKERAPTEASLRRSRGTADRLG